MVRNIIPVGVECIFVRQAEQLGLGHAVLCAERAVGDEPFAVLLADDFLTDYEPGVTADLVHAFENSGKSQISVMEVNGPDISKYGVIVPNRQGVGVTGLVEKPLANEAPSNLASVGRYVLTPDIFGTLLGLSSDQAGKSNLLMQSTYKQSVAMSKLFELTDCALIVAQCMGSSRPLILYLIKEKANNRFCY